jgi:hypothetical protein
MNLSLFPDLERDRVSRAPRARAAAAAARTPRPAPISTGWRAVDALLAGGGLPRGRIVELSGAWSSGKTALALGAAARLTSRGRVVAYVDVRRELYPPTAEALGVDLGRLLVVRPPPVAAAIARAAEIVARSGEAPLVLIDLPDGHRLDDAAAARLAAAAAASATAVVVLAARPGAVPRPAVRLEVHADPADAGHGASVSIHVRAAHGRAAAPGAVARIALARGHDGFHRADAAARLTALELPPPVLRARTPTDDARSDP